MKKTTVIVRKRYLKREKRRKLLRASALLLFAVLSVGILTTVFTSDASDDIGRMKYYTSVEIQPGDTLWSVADTFMSEEYADRSAYIGELCRLNHLSGDAVIHAGQFLVVPYYGDVR